MPKKRSESGSPKKVYLKFHANISGPIPPCEKSQALQKWIERNKEFRTYEIGEVLSSSGRVSTTRCAWAVIGSPDTPRRLQNGPGLVAKFVNLQHEKYGTQNTQEHVFRQLQAAEREIGHISSRLRNCPHANPIFDLTIVRDQEGFGVLTPVTMQLKLDNCFQLDDWLFKHHLRDVARKNSPDTLNDTSGWKGLKTVKDWARISLAIGHGLHSIHLHRAVHGDVHPGNIFLTNNDLYPSAIFIDFAESFLVLDSAGSRDRRLHPYLAPECQTVVSRRNDSIDRYSFGMLLLYLASGVEEVLDKGIAQNDRKQAINDLMMRNRSDDDKGIIHDDPRILDLINKCVVTFPGDRISLSEACAQLHRIYEDACGADWKSICCPFTSHNIPRIPNLDRVNNLLEASSSGQRKVHPVVQSLVAHQLFELEEMLLGLNTDMFQIYNTRDRVVRSLISVVDELEKGDSWTAATTLDLWHGRGLGLEGSYHTSMIRAVQREASIRRVFILTAEDLGSDCILSLANCLRQEKHESMAKVWETASMEWSSQQRISNQPENSDAIKWFQERLKRLLVFLNKQANLLQDPSTIVNQDIWNTTGLCVSIRVVASRKDAEGLKSKNPAAIVYLTGQNDRHRWLLVTAETHLAFDKDKAVNRQHLVGARVYSSAMKDHYPLDRIVHLRDIFAESFPLTPNSCCALLSALEHRVLSNENPETQMHPKKQFKARKK